MVDLERPVKHPRPLKTGGLHRLGSLKEGEAKSIANGNVIMTDLLRQEAADLSTTGNGKSPSFRHRPWRSELISQGEPPGDIGVYLDSGWPGDNYEVTIAMATALIAPGRRYGHNLLHACFPNAVHNENAWGMRLHIPLQFFNGAVALVSRALHPVLGD
jgi:hypothetical protein